MTAQRECQKVVDKVSELKSKATGEDKTKPIVSIFTHEDETVSIGISGDTEASANFAKQLQDSLNPDGGEKYKVLGITSDEFKGYLKDSGVRETDIEELGENPIGFCAEPKAAILAHDNPSPITGMDTRNPRNKNNYPYNGVDRTTAKQMRPCTTCYLCEKEYMQYANANKK